ncbi:RNA polymerase sigma-70 factor (ECF subfamily) [Agromyces flavus]|uniref:RNA polymerase sigma-70 factor (ECF subfamily) n=1 Tax=Agromyces flavus TaxID=589382 RepID=A0A1H1NV58_9MICO|nr:RNA polymerase sigma-70 factor [Agromyces flavus]MCP2368045.1 RNA polymerase sigma-70 factor (ECF subfamily) [Agromyces flavus]GGI47507.1 RNA polymerase subunit sigma-24 [Agromyces flavus]SDS02259.1 RNA polymerase sigma-70 factor, ECF subfamily [Agromyces flavus]
MTEPGDALADLRPLMFSIAYRMLGSVTEAEDVVQDAYLRLHERTRAGEEIRRPEAFATTVTTRLAIDALRSARRNRELYVGSWLPEPLPDANADPAHRVEHDETLSFAFLAVLERLGPVERAVFLLREVFDVDYSTIAGIVERSEASCRQVLHRARSRIADGRPRFDPDVRRDAVLIERFFDALSAGDVDALARTLADDVVFYGDGGGKAPAIRRPIEGRVAVARFLAGLVRRGEPLPITMERVQANGEAALRISTGGATLSVLMVHAAGGRIAAVGNQLNPDKLRHLGPVGDLEALMAQGARPPDRGSEAGGSDGAQPPGTTTPVS